MCEVEEFSENSFDVQKAYMNYCTLFQTICVSLAE